MDAECSRYEFRCFDFQQILAKSWDALFQLMTYK